MLLVPTASAWTVQYYTNGGICVTAGQGAITPGYYANIGGNTISSWATCFPGGTNYMGTNYMRSDGSRVGDKWSSDWFNGVTDTRSIAYGKPICEANGGNPSGVSNFYCIAGS
jgi:hypothetical protein